MYYFIFRSYQDIRRTESLHDIVFESKDSYVNNEMLRFFKYIQSRQFHYIQRIDSYRKLTSIFYADIRDSIELKKQFCGLVDMVESSETDINCKNEIQNFLHFLGFITGLLSTLPNKTCTLEIISVEDNLPIDC